MSEASFSEKDIEALKKSLLEILDEQEKEIGNVPTAISILSDNTISSIKNLVGESEESFALFSEIASIDVNSAQRLAERLSDYHTEQSGNIIGKILSTLTEALEMSYSLVESATEDSWKDMEMGIINMIQLSLRLLENIGEEITNLSGSARNDIEWGIGFANSVIGMLTGILTPDVSNIEQNVGISFPLILVLSEFLDSARGFKIEDLISRMSEMRKTLRMADTEAMMELIGKALKEVKTE